MASGKRSSFLLDLRDLRTSFDAVDTERRGYIDFDGLKLMIEDMEGLDHSMAHELMDSLDRNKDGKVTFEDFQTLFTLRRDEVKHQLGREEESTDSATYVTALPSPDAISPDRPPIPPGQRSKRRDSRGSSITQVPKSPDLTTHARSLKGSILHSPQLGPRTLSLSSIDSGDLFLEDVGIAVGDMPPSPSFTVSAMTAASSARSKSEGLQLIYKELEVCCPTGLVNREGIVQLCERLRYDASDAQEMLDIWQELEDQAPRAVTIEMMCDCLREKEAENVNTAIGIVTSTPAVPQPQQTRTWNEKPLRLSESFDQIVTVHHPLETSPDQQPQEKKPVESMEGSLKEHGEMEQSTSFPFPDHSLHLNTASMERSRLSRGPLSESNLHRPANSAVYVKNLQQELAQVSQERDSLKLNLSRVEDERKMLIKEGDEGFAQLVREREEKLRRMEEDYKARRKQMETSLTEDRLQVEEQAQGQIAALERELKLVKSNEEKMKAELEHYRDQKEWLDNELDRVREEILLKNKKIEMLQATLDEKSEGGSEVDFLAQVARIQELEMDLETYNELNQNLLDSCRELNDKVDELKAENEQLKQKVIDEKRKRQRKKSGSSLRRSPSGSKGTRKQSRKGSREVQSPLPEAVDNGFDESREVIALMDEGAADIAVEALVSGSDHEASVDLSESEDEMVARSSASLMEEMHVQNQKAVIGQRLENLLNRKSFLETSCNDLRSQLDNLKENKAALRQQIEQELKRKMYQHAHLEKHIKQLNQLKDVLATARRAFSSQIQDSEQYLTQYLEGLETDIDQFNSEDAELGMSHKEENLQLSQKVKELEEELESARSSVEVTAKETAALKEAYSTQRMTLAQADEEKESLVAKHSSELTRVSEAHVEEVENLNAALRKQATALEELQERTEMQKFELEQTISRLKSSLDGLNVEKKLAEDQHAAEVQKMKESMAADKVQLSELANHVDTCQKEIQLLQTAKQQLDSERTELLSRLTLLQEEYTELNRHEKALEKKVDAQDRQLKTKQAELALAIHDLTAKEQECSELQEKMEQMDGGLTETEAEQLTQKLDTLRAEKQELQNQLLLHEERLLEGRDQLLKATQENSQLKSANAELTDDLAKSINEVKILSLNLEKLENEALEAKKKEENKEVYGDESADGGSQEQFVVQELQMLESHEISLPSSPLQSPNTSYSSQDAFSHHEEIVKQMKSQLEDLQSILISRTGNDSTSSEISIIQELLTSNQTLLAQLKQQQQRLSQHDICVQQQLAAKAERIKSLLNSISAVHITDKLDLLEHRLSVASSAISQLQSTLEERDTRHMSALDSLLEGSATPENNLDQADSSQSEMEKIKILETENNALKEELTTIKAQQTLLEEMSAKEMLEKNLKLSETERKVRLQDDIIQRQKLEMERLNYHLGKAKVRQNHYDDKIVERNKQIEDKDREILNQSQEIQHLKEEVIKVCSETDVNHDQLLQSHEAELLMQQESLQAAEDVIEAMRHHLNDLYQIVINPSDSSTYDVLELSELAQHIREGVEKMKADLSQEQEARQTAEVGLKQRTEDYDQLYSEHEDEVTAVLQQKQQLQLLLEDLQGHYHEQAQASNQLLIKNSDLAQSMHESSEEAVRLQAQLHNLQKQRTVLINLVQTISLQAVSTFC